MDTCFLWLILTLSFHFFLFTDKTAHYGLGPVHFTCPQSEVSDHSARFIEVAYGQHVESLRRS